MIFSDKKQQLIELSDPEPYHKVVLLLDDDVYEKSIHKRYDEACKKAFDDKVKLIQFFSADDAFNYLVSNKVHVIVSSIVEYVSIEAYPQHLGGGDIFIKVCKSLYKEVPFIAWSSSDDDKDSFFKYNAPDVYINKGPNLSELF